MESKEFLKRKINNLFGDLTTCDIEIHLSVYHNNIRDLIEEYNNLVDIYDVHDSDNKNLKVFKLNSGHLFRPKKTKPL